MTTMSRMGAVVRIRYVNILNVLRRGDNSSASNMVIKGFLGSFSRQRWATSQVNVMLFATLLALTDVSLYPAIIS